MCVDFFNEFVHIGKTFAIINDFEQEYSILLTKMTLPGITDHTYLKTAGTLVFKVWIVKCTRSSCKRNSLECSVDEICIMEAQWRGRVTYLGIVYAKLTVVEEIGSTACAFIKVNSKRASFFASDL